MTVGLRVRPGHDVRIVWLCALCVLLGGASYVQTRYQTAIHAAQERTETLYRQTVADERTIRAAAGLRAVQARAQDDLAHLSQTASLSATTAALLSELDQSAHRFDSQVTGLEPGAVQPSPDTKDRARGGGELRATALTIHVRGRFRSLLQFVEDLSHHSTLIRVSDTEMALAAGAGSEGSEPHLDATIHAIIYRLLVPKRAEYRIASAA